MDRRSRTVDVVRVDGPTHDTVVREEPLQLRLAARGGPSQAVWTTLRTPGHDLDLALGWCVAEGVVRSMDDVVDVHHCDGAGHVDRNAVTVRLDTDAVAPVAAQSHSATAACGLCGRRDLQDVIDRCTHRDGPEVRTSLPELNRLLVAMAGHQPLHTTTGGAHAAATASCAGTLQHVREDVGRHNAVDAVIGATLRAGDTPGLLLLSGRAGFELVAKAATAGVAVVASVGAATDLAVRTADAAGLTLVTFLGRAHGGTVLTGAQRLHDVTAGAIA